MTKTEQRKAQTKSVMEMLINKYNAYNIEDEMGGRIIFFIDTLSDLTFRGEYHRTNQDINIYESIELAGKGWSEEEINKVREAKKYEELLNREIETLITQYLAV